MQTSSTKALAVLTQPAGQTRHHLSRDIRVSAPFIVQLAASHAGIGPFRTHFRERPAIALACYQAADMSDRSRG